MFENKTGSEGHFYGPEDKMYHLPDGTKLVVTEEVLLSIRPDGRLPLITSEENEFGGLLALIDKQTEELKRLKQENDELKGSRNSFRSAWSAQKAITWEVIEEKDSLVAKLNSAYESINQSLSETGVEGLLLAVDRLKSSVIAANAVQERRKQEKQKVLHYLNGLPVIDQSLEGDAYIIVEKTPEVIDDLRRLGVTKAVIDHYGDADTFCILALANSEGYATDFDPGVGLML